MSARARKKTFHIVSFGCRVNQAEGLTLSAGLQALGLGEARSECEADLLIVNTCVVTGEAGRQGRQRVRRALRSGVAVVVTGCGAHPGARDTAMQKIAGPLFLEPDKARIPDRLRAAWPDLEETADSSLGEAVPGSRSRAMLKVQDGCPASCAYCIVPKVRPDVRSTPPDDAVRQLEGLVAAGFREVVVCGIHLGLYGTDLEPAETLTDLLGRFLAVPGLGRLRLSSIEPMEVGDDLLDLMAAESARVCPHLHLPFQSGSDDVLRRMGRPYTRAEFLSTVQRIRRVLPAPAITADVLVGFPGETDAAFAATLQCCEAAAFARMHVFPFSRRPGTRAAEMQAQTPPDVIRDRRQRASDLGERLAEAYRESLVGTTARVAIETMLPRGAAEGLSERYVRVRLRPPLPPHAERRAIVAARLLRTRDKALEADALAD